MAMVLGSGTGLEYHNRSWMWSSDVLQVLESLMSKPAGVCPNSNKFSENTFVSY